MTKAFEVALLRLALDLVDRFPRGDFYADHGCPYGAVNPCALT
jgi:hypothetical protein